MAHQNKLRIPHKYKGDFSLLQQQIDDAIKKAFVQTAQIESQKRKPKFQEVKPSMQRRIQQFFLRVGSQFRNSVEYTKSTQKDYQKVVQEPDRNLQKINQVKLSMLGQTYGLVKNSNWSQMQIPLQVRKPQTIEVVHCQQYKQDIQNTFNRIQESLGNQQQKIDRIVQLEKMVINTMKKLQIQEKRDRDQIIK